jgi:hypothetical protein
MVMSSMMRPGARKPLYRHLAVSTTSSGISIVYDFPTSITLRSPTREKELRRRVRTRQRRWRPDAKSTDGTIVTAAFEDPQHAKVAIDATERMPDAFAEEKLTPQMVEEILGITSAERVRWNRTGGYPNLVRARSEKGVRCSCFSCTRPPKSQNLRLIQRSSRGGARRTQLRRRLRRWARPVDVSRKQHAMNLPRSPGRAAVR